RDGGIHLMENLEGDGYVFGQGGDGNDRIYGSANGDVLIGGNGNNLLVGAGGNDILVSYGMADATAEPEKQCDVLMGGDGDDMLIALGDSAVSSPVHMYGGSGSDTFVIAPLSNSRLQEVYGDDSTEKAAGFHRDVVIHDFVIGEDKIDLSWLRVKGEGGE